MVLSVPIPKHFRGTLIAKTFTHSGTLILTQMPTPVLQWLQYLFLYFCASNLLTTAEVMNIWKRHKIVFSSIKLIISQRFTETWVIHLCINFHKYANNLTRTTQTTELVSKGREQYKIHAKYSVTSYITLSEITYKKNKICSWIASLNLYYNGTV